VLLRNAAYRRAIRACDADDYAAGLAPAILFLGIGAHHSTFAVDATSIDPFKNARSKNVLSKKDSVEKRLCRKKTLSKKDPVEKSLARARDRRTGAAGASS
jgi:hypothetical protein